MKRQWKGFMAGIMVSMLTASIIGTAAATVGSKSVTLNYNNIKVTLDGKQVELLDANGAAVEPFTINGTTYLPVRAVANALELDVGWDGTTQTVKLTNKTEMKTGELIMDMNDVKVYFNGIVKSQSYSGGYELKLRIENNSDRDFTVSADDCSVNGIMVSEWFYCSVASGKVANDCISITKSALEDSGITGAITNVEFKLHFADSGDYRKSFDSDIIKIR